MKRLLLLLMLASVSVARADLLFEQANEAYADGRYRQAAEGYEELLARDGPRVSVLQNLGSTYHRLGDDGRAILAFERALLLKPRDPDLRANLKLVRDRTAVFPGEAPGAWNKVAGVFSRYDWSVIALAGAALLPLAALGWILPRGRRLRMAMVATAAFGLLLASSSLAALRATSGLEAVGIVVGDPATVRVSPFGTADEKGSLPAGRQVRLGAERNGWFWVGLDEGSADGWVGGGEVEPLVPRR